MNSPDEHDRLIKHAHLFGPTKITFEKLVAALFDLYWILFPFVIVLIVGSWVGGLTKLSTHPDMMLLTSVFFGESTWRSRRLKVNDREKTAMELLGFTGFCFSAIAAAFLVANTYGNQRYLLVLITNDSFWNSLMVLWITAPMYACLVRLKAIDENGKIQW